MRRLELPGFRQLSVFRQSTNLAAMPSSLETQQLRERLRVGQRFLRLRPRIAAVAAIGNAAVLAASGAPPAQKLALGGCFALTVGAFFAEAAWLARHELSERWLYRSLSLTLLALTAGAAASGGLTSPVLPLLFAPVVVGFAAFAQQREARRLLAVALALLALLAMFGRFAALPSLPSDAREPMLVISSVASFALLFVGVSGLVEAHSRTAHELDRLRIDLLTEAERRAVSVENLGAQVAHEVKNPLTAARGLVQLVQRRVDERDQQRLDVVLTEMDRALTVLHDYLSFARPLSDLSLAPVSARALLEDVAGVLEARAQEKSVTLQITSDNAQIWGDRQRLRDAVLNLALNAINALPRDGKLTLAAHHAGERLQLSVTDDGPGISAELLAKLGEPFTTGSEHGTGLGVMLARSVARQHGGELRIESTAGAGARAWLELPVATSMTERS